MEKNKFWMTSCLLCVITAGLVFGAEGRKSEPGVKREAAAEMALVIL